MEKKIDRDEHDDDDDDDDKEGIEPTPDLVLVARK